jgi:hypothetical protein
MCSQDNSHAAGEFIIPTKIGMMKKDLPSRESLRDSPDHELDSGRVLLHHEVHHLAGDIDLLNNLLACDRGFHLFVS